MKVVKIGATLVVLGVGFYFGLAWMSRLQDKTNIKRREIEKQSDGGEMGHIADLYDVLDKTDPNRHSRYGDAGQDAQIPRLPSSARNPGAPGALPNISNLPLVAAVWTLDVAAARIPEGRANGKVSGTDFVPDNVRVDLAGAAHVLSFRQGAGVNADRQMLVFLHLKQGEIPAGHSWTVSKDMKGTGVPQVAKLWKTNPKYAPLRKNFSTGYAMKLEFGQMSDGVIPGKIFLALPDEEQSIVAGVFNAETSSTDMGEATPPFFPVR